MIYLEGDMMAWRWLRGWSALLDLFLPPACALCGKTLASAAEPQLCPTCLSDIPPLGPASCRRCALPYPAENGSDHLCQSCLLQPPPFARVVTAGIYDRALRQAIHRFKFDGAIGLDRPLAHLLARVLGEAPENAFDLLVPVPLHPARLRHRTYNQSLLLGRELSRLTGLPLRSELLRRLRPTPPQQGLDAEERRRNLRGAFAAPKPLHGQRILLLDDVLTTGATARECSSVLLDAGASEVSVAVLARAPRHFS